MEQSHYWEANFRSAAQEIPRIILHLNFHNCFYNSLSRVLILSQINPGHNTQPYFFKVQTKKADFWMEASRCAYKRNII